MLNEWAGVFPSLVLAACAAWLTWSTLRRGSLSAPQGAERRDGERSAGGAEPLLIHLSGAFLLAGSPVEEGEPVEILLPDGRWLGAELRAEPGGWPSLWVTLGGPWEHSTNGATLRRPYLAARVSPDALMRRPVASHGGHNEHV